MTLKTWAFAVVPAAALLELLAHFVQVSTVPSDADWTRARDVVKGRAHADDLVVFAPRWSDPIGRMTFGSDVATMEREAYADVSRYPRAIEVSMRGQHERDLVRWKPAAEEKVGPFTITTFENPAYIKTVDDLMPHGRLDDRMEVALGDTPCTLERRPPQTGNLGFGPAVPADRFQCGQTFVGVSVIADLEYRAHRCLYAPPVGPTPLRVGFRDVAFGDVLHGHHGLYVEAERSGEGAPITISFRVGDKRLGKLTHTDGEGWKEFELPTGDLKGQKGDLVAEITAANGHRRMYCFEAITR